MKICSKCNKELDNKAEFCVECGSPAIEVFPCPQCGKNVASGAAFCGSCGVKLKGRNSNNKKKIICAIIAALAVLLVVGLIVALRIFNKKEEVDIEAVSTVEFDNNNDRPVYYGVHLNVYDATTFMTDENGIESIKSVDDVAIYVRKGADNKDGQVIENFDANGADGISMINALLPDGTYTLQIDAPGYVSSFNNITVEGKTFYSNIYMVPVPSDDTIMVLLVWEGNSDLDLTVFNYGAGKDAYYSFVGGDSSRDSYGNNLICDNSNTCEVISLKATDQGSFKIFVNDYTNSSKMTDENNVIADGNASVYIYNSKGLVGAYSYPLGSTGLVWEVAEVSGNGESSSPCQTTYSDITSQSLWYADKGFDVNDAKLREALAYSEHEESAYYSSRGESAGKLFNVLEAIAVCDSDKIVEGNPDIIVSMLAVKRESGSRCKFDFGVSIPTYPGPSYTYYPYDEPEETTTYLTSVNDLENLIYSIIGKRVDLSKASDVTVVDYQGEKYFQTADVWYSTYGSPYRYVHDISDIEYIGNNVWKVSMNVYTYDLWDSAGLVACDYKVEEVDFYLVPNPTSEYGFNVIKCEERQLDTGWYDIYNWFIHDDEEIVRMHYDFYGKYRYDYCPVSTLIYLNEDEIPELVLKHFGDYYIYSIKDGRAYLCYRTSIGAADYIDQIKYVPYKDMIYAVDRCDNVLEGSYHEETVCFNVVANSSFNNYLSNRCNQAYMISEWWEEYDGYDPNDNWIEIECDWELH